MFTKLFTTILRSIALPYVFYLILAAGILEDKQAWLVVSITLTLAIALSLVIQTIGLLPKLVLLKGNKILISVVSMAIEIGSVLGFWYYYVTQFE